MGDSRLLIVDDEEIRRVIVEALGMEPNEQRETQERVHERLRGASQALASWWQLRGRGPSRKRLSQKERGTITVRTGQSGNNIWIEVEDTGCGIPPENKTQVFDPFFTTKDVGKGTGMGLHLAYKIIEAHGGRIKVESEVGKGTTFHIELPLTGPSEVKETQSESVA